MKTLGSVAALLALLDFTGAAEKRLGQALAPVGLTLTQYRALALLQAADDAMHQRALARALSRDDSNVTSLVDGLQKAGLVVRTEFPTDRRRTMIALTDEGEQRLQRGRRIVTAVARDLVPREQIAAVSALVALPAEGTDHGEATSDA